MTASPEVAWWVNTQFLEVHSPFRIGSYQQVAPEFLCLRAKTELILDRCSSNESSFFQEKGFVEVFAVG